MPRLPVVITGASTGIGEACALDLASRGDLVFAGVRRDEDGERLRAAGGDNVHPVRIDVVDESSIDAARDEVLSIVGDDGIHGLVNNAGIAVNGPLELVSGEDLRRQFEVNVFGQLAVTQRFLPLLRRGRGRIVNMSSISGRVTAPFLGPYSMSKFALEAMSDALRRELQAHGVDVSCVEPGAIATPIWNKALDAPENAQDALPAGASELYGAGLEGLRKIATHARDNAVPAERVARVVHHALHARRPRTRYLVGPDARVQAILARWLPDRWLDAAFRRMMGTSRTS